MPVSKRVRSFVPEALTTLLTRLLREPNLPLLDHWFSQQEVSQKGLLWEQLRLAVLLSEAYLRALEPRGTAPLRWEDVRQGLRSRVSGWAAFTATTPSGPLEDPTRWGLPAWLSTEWKRRVSLSNWSPEQQESFWHGQVTAPGLHLRFCGPEAERGLEEWRHSGGTIRELIPGVWKAQGPQSVFALEAWKKGALEVQDAASYEAAQLVGARPGQVVWDVCAGRGGKTAVLAEEMRGKGALWATDVAQFKLTELKKRIARAGWQNVRVQAWDGRETLALPHEARLRGGFDRVLVDAPCSASGTWRRDPDARYRLNPGVLKVLEDKQDSLLQQGWEALRPGGLLTYVTCSWLPRENEDRVAHFEKNVGNRARRRVMQLRGLPDMDANTLFTCQWEKVGD